jgi:hypothetical protein
MDGNKPLLSELIRKGATMVDGQCRGEFVVYEDDKILCCALGAAYLAATGYPPPMRNGDVDGSSVLNLFADYPDVGVDEPLTDWVTEHNDEGQTFEELAAQLESMGL